MKRIAIGRNGHQIKGGFSDIWGTVPWLTLHRTGALLGRGIDGAQQAQHLSAYASQDERTVAGTVAGAMQKQRMKETNSKEQR